MVHLELGAKIDAYELKDEPSYGITTAMVLVNVGGEYTSTDPYGNNTTDVLERGDKLPFNIRKITMSDGSFVPANAITLCF